MPGLGPGIQVFRAAQPWMAGTQARPRAACDALCPAMATSTARRAPCERHRAMPDATAFHFLRPWWLLALVPTALLLALILRRERPEVQWSGVIAPHLLRHLIVTPRGH